MKEYIEDTYLGMVNALTALYGDPAQPQTLAAGLDLVAKALQILRGYIIANQFPDDTSEIHFFKTVKPRFYSWNIFLVERQQLLNHKPAGTPKMQRKYLLEELKYVTRNRERHISAFRYYHDDDVHRDAQYFLRANLEPLREGQEFALPDPGFTTNMDYLFSKFRALDMLEDHIIEQIHLLEAVPFNCTAHALRWTGEKVNLVELAYGLFYTGQLNDGKADIMDIITWLRDTLAISITREQAYRIYLDIRRRKVIPYTRFIDQMQNALRDNINESYR